MVGDTVSATIRSKRAIVIVGTSCPTLRLNTVAVDASVILTQAAIVSLTGSSAPRINASVGVGNANVTLYANGYTDFE